jgi:hypothetical protein
LKINYIGGYVKKETDEYLCPKASIELFGGRTSRVLTAQHMLLFCPLSGAVI